MMFILRGDQGRTQSGFLIFWKPYKFLRIEIDFSQIPCRKRLSRIRNLCEPCKLLREIRVSFTYCVILWLYGNGSYNNPERIFPKGNHIEN